MKKILLILLMTTLPVAANGADAVKLHSLGSAYTDVAGMGLLEPEGVGCNKTSAVVSDTGRGRLVRFTLEGGAVKPGAEFRLSQLAYPQRVRLNSLGDLYVVDGKTRRILRLKPDGELRAVVEPAGVWLPKSIALDDKDNLYVLDAANNRVVVVGDDGVVRKQLPYPEAGGFFSDVAVNFQGTIFLLNSVAGSLYSAPQDAAAFTLLVKGLKDYVSFPTALAVERKHIFVVDQNGSGLVILGLDGSFQGHKLKMGWKEGELRYPSDICLDANGNVFIADRGNNRVQVFTRIEEGK